MRLGVGRGPALAALLAAEPADPEEGVLLHGLAPTTVVAAPVLRQAAEYAEVAIRDRHQSPCCSLAQRRLLNLLRSGGPVDVAGSSLQPLSHPMEAGVGLGCDSNPQPPDP
jgi:hypothetical protein